MPSKSPTRRSLTPTRRSARILHRQSLALATPEDLALRIIQLESKFEDMATQMSNNNVAQQLESLLPQVTVSLLTDGTKQELEGIRDTLSEMQDDLLKSKAKWELIRKDNLLGQRREEEYLARIHQMKSEKQVLKEANTKLKNLNQRLEQQNIASAEKMEVLTEVNEEKDEKIALLQDQIRTHEAEKVKNEHKMKKLTLEFTNLATEYSNAVDKLQPILQAATPQKVRYQRPN